MFSFSWPLGTLCAVSSLLSHNRAGSSDPGSPSSVPGSLLAEPHVPGTRGVGKLAAFMPRPIIYTRRPLRQLPKTWALISQRCISSPALQTQNNPALLDCAVESRIKPCAPPGTWGREGDRQRKTRQIENYIKKPSAIPTKSV